MIAESFLQNLDNWEHLDKWTFKSPAQDRKKWTISSRDFLEIENLVNTCDQLPCPHQRLRNIWTATYNNSLWMIGRQLQAPAHAHFLKFKPTCCSGNCCGCSSCSSSCSSCSGCSSSCSGWSCYGSLKVLY